MSQGDEVARSTERTLHIHNREDVVVEEVDEPLHGVELTAREAVTQRLYLQQKHDFHNLIGNSLTRAAGVRHHQVDLKFCQMVMSDGDVTE